MVAKQGRGRGGVRAAGKGFGELSRKKNKKGGAEVSTPKESVTCPCGGGEEHREYGDCCARYHGGVVEDDALTLMSKVFCRLWITMSSHRDLFLFITKVFDDIIQIRFAHGLSDCVSAVPLYRSEIQCVCAEQDRVRCQNNSS